MAHSTIARRSLAAGAALALALGLGGCSTINSIFGSGDDVKRDDSTGEVTEEGTSSAFDVQVGDCFLIPDSDEFSDLNMVPCANEHDAEAYFNFDVELPGDTFDENGIAAAADERCAAEFSNYVGASLETSKYYYNYFTPLSDGWDEGDRVVNCILFETDPTSGNLVTTTGSAKGSGE